MSIGHLVGGPEDRNDKGELVNEEGLPIIEIKEPAVDVVRGPAPPLAPDVVPIVSLPESERERKKRNRDRILDQLEQEELLEESRQEEQESTNRREKRSNAAQEKFDLEKLRAAREMQKKMGKALLKNMAAARERDEKIQQQAVVEQPPPSRRTTLKPKKSVSFAELPSDAEEADDEQGSSARTASNFRSREEELDWGDVMPGRLRPKKKNEPMSRAAMARHTMRLDVVERIPRPNPPPPTLDLEERDSDDESVPGSPVPADSDEGEAIHSDREEDDLPTPRAGPQPRHSASDDEEDDDDIPGDHDLADEFDLDLARHQREVALEYYEKRQAIGAETAKAMTSHTHDGPEEWDQAEVPLEATLSEPHPKPSMSRFAATRANRTGSGQTPTSTHTTQQSTSLGATVLSAATSHTLQRAIRTGKLENDKLVSAQESEGEDDETMREVLELLKKGEVYNIGPDGEYITKPTAAPGAVQEPTGVVPPKAKVSRFKANRPPIPTVQSDPATPVNEAGWSSPKFPAPPGPPTSIINVLERKPPAPRASESSSSLSKPPAAVQSPPMIGSPSFAAPAAKPKKMPSNIVESPSFPRSQSSSSGNNNNARAASSSRPQQPPSIMSLAVKESGRKTGERRTVDDEDEPPRKMSKFLVDRM